MSQLKDASLNPVARALLHTDVGGVPTPVSTTNPLTTAPTSGALTDKSGTITTGGTAQTAAAANTARKYLLIQNPSTAPGSLWFSTVTTAVAASPSVELVPGASYESGLFCPTGAVSIIGATTGQAFTAREG